MGSSPVTATTSLLGASEGAIAALAAAVERCLREHGAGGAANAEEPIVVAFSGGPDSLALLLAVRRPASKLRLHPIAAHVDHRLDPGSAARAEVARRLAGQLDVPFRLLVAPSPDNAKRESREAAARRIRYRLLDELRRELGARFVLTAHHADDQAETVLLRLAHGSGLAGLAGMAPRHQTVVRPLLSVPRRDLRAAIVAAQLAPLADPTNHDLSLPRNRLRHLLLPVLGEKAAAGARSLGAAAALLAAGVERRLVELLPALAESRADAAPPRLPLRDLRRLPAELLPWALALLHRRSGVEYPPRAVAVAELRRQLYRCDRVTCDCGGGWRWRTDRAGRLRVEPAALGHPERPEVAASPFTYTVEERGEVEISEAGTTVRSSQPPVAARVRRMRRGAPATVETR
ncbi:MAG TPA: tRNA lysidine(34) synthetase TilS [Thermoanaerobaculia bacterium]|nr:tRNA lysidine(34) synthetase TilS [Thermoanaerobaculia bacterium]